MAITAPVRVYVWAQNFVKILTVQGEDKSRVISAEIFEKSNVSIELSGYTACVYVLEQNGRKVTEPAIISDHTVTATIPFLSSAGNAEVQICLTKPDSEMLKITGITLDVQPSELEGAVEASDEYNHLAAATVAAQQATADALDAAEITMTATEEIQRRADSGEFDGASGTIDTTTKSPLTGLLKGNGTNIVSAVDGVDYVSANNYAHLATPLTSGVSTAQTLTLNPPLTAYTPGLMLAVNFHIACGGGRCTLDINGLGARNIRPFMDYAGVSFAAGVHVIVYDGEQWRMQPDIKALLDLAHPVGSIYISIEDLNPGEFLGGIWAAFAQGRFILGAGGGYAGGSTGGATTVALTTAQLPRHTHSSGTRTTTSGTNIAGTGLPPWGGSNVAGVPAESTLLSTSAGSNQPHNNMPPYIVCYIWRRTA